MDQIENELKQKRKKKDTSPRLLGLTGVIERAGFLTFISRGTNSI